jgi:predicted RNA methylase
VLSVGVPFQEVAMRLAAQMRGGFYPAAPQAIAHTAKFLRPPERGSFAILDPCAGEGAAILPLGELLGCPPAMTFAIELDDSRAETLRTTLHESRVLAPASFFGCRASANSFSFIWLNPPFDEGYGGHRVERNFLQRATDWLMPGGVMALVCPEDVADHSDTRQFFLTYFEHCKIVPFPAKHRSFNEVVVSGQKRLRVHSDTATWQSMLTTEDFVYRIPSSSGPRYFEKLEPTETELQCLLATSPLRTHLTAPVAPSLPSPPLALGVGHMALLLASGHLDGLVEPDGKPPHVARGTSRKREYIADVSETENDDGTTTKKTTIAEKIELMVRTVDLSGRIRTFGETAEKRE